MNVYELMGRPDEYQGLTTEGAQDWTRELEWFKGRPMAHHWSPPTLAIYYGKRGAHLPGDFPGFDGIFPIFNPRAVEALGDLLRPNGELLPIHSPMGTCYAFNVLALIDALDEEHSEIMRQSSGGIIDIRRYAFHPERLTDAVIFKLPQDPVSTYVTDPFVKRVEEAGLLGFRFDLLWPLPQPRPRGGRRRPARRATA